MDQKELDRIIDFLIVLEGGYKVHKNQGEDDITFAGIYRKANPDWEGWYFVDREMLEHAKEEAKEFYRRLWKKYNLDEVYKINKSVAVQVFVFGVNAGMKRAIKLLQRLIGVKADGIIGKQTLTALKNSNLKALPFDYSNQVQIFYNKLACKLSRYKIFLNGWTNRNFKTLKFSLLVI